MVARRAAGNELSRELILDRARELFVQKGYAQVSMRQLASELGSSHGAIYYHFKNKAELFYALVRKDFTLLNQKLEEILAQEGKSNQDRLAKILLGFIEFGLRNQSHYEIMFMVKDEEVKSYIQEEPNMTYQKFASAIFKLTNQEISVSEIWSIFLSLHGFVSHYCKSGQTFDDVKELAISHVHFLIKGIT